MQHTNGNDKAGRKILGRGGMGTDLLWVGILGIIMIFMMAASYYQGRDFIQYLERQIDQSDAVIITVPGDSPEPFKMDFRLRGNDKGQGVQAPILTTRALSENRRSSVACQLHTDNTSFTTASVTLASCVADGQQPVVNNDSSNTPITPFATAAGSAFSPAARLLSSDSDAKNISPRRHEGHEGQQGCNAPILTTRALSENRRSVVADDNLTSFPKRAAGEQAHVLTTRALSENRRSSVAYHNTNLTSFTAAAGKPSSSIHAPAANIKSYRRAVGSAAARNIASAAAQTFTLNLSHTDASGQRYIQHSRGCPDQLKNNETVEPQSILCNWQYSNLSPRRSSRVSAAGEVQAPILSTRASLEHRRSVVAATVYHNSNVKSCWSCNAPTYYRATSNQSPRRSSRVSAAGGSSTTTKWVTRYQRLDDAASGHLQADRLSTLALTKNSIHHRGTKGCKHPS